VVGKRGTGHVDVSRFQLLIFTFVIVISFVKLTEANNEFPKVDSGVLTLLGITASTYAVGKGIQQSSDGQQPFVPKHRNQHCLPHPRLRKQGM
jgi:hypothetical protein